MAAMVGNDSGVIHDGTVYEEVSDSQTFPPQGGKQSPLAADDSGIYITFSDDPAKTEELEAEEVQPGEKQGTASLSPVVLIVPGVTPLAVLAREELKTPKGAPKPPRLHYNDQQEQETPNYPATLGTVDEGFEFYQRENIEHKLSRELLYYPKDFLSMQPEVTPGMRSLLLDWLQKTSRKCNLKQETLFLAANIVDRFLSVTALSSDCLQLLGIVAIFIAGKQEENSPLEVSQLLQLSEETFSEEKYSKKQALLLERLVLGRLQFCLHPPTSLFFMETLATHRVTGCRLDTGMLDSIEARRRLARYILEVCLHDYSMCRFRPSIIAASTLTGAEEVLDDGYLLFRPGPHSLVDLEFRTCLQEIRMTIDSAIKNNQNIDEIMKFYSSKP